MSGGRDIDGPIELAKNEAAAQGSGLRAPCGARKGGGIEGIFERFLKGKKNKEGEITERGTGEK